MEGIALAYSRPHSRAEANTGHQEEGSESPHDRWPKQAARSWRGLWNRRIHFLGKMPTSEELCRLHAGVPKGGQEEEQKGDGLKRYRVDQVPDSLDRVIFPRQEYEPSALLEERLRLVESQGQASCEPILDHRECREHREAGHATPQRKSPGNQEQGEDQHEMAVLIGGDLLRDFGQFPEVLGPLQK